MLTLLGWWVKCSIIKHISHTSVYFLSVQIKHMRLIICQHSMSISVCLSDSVCQSVYLLSVCLSVYLSVCLSIFLYVCLSVCLSFCLSIYLSVCLSVCLSYSDSLSVCLSVCLSFRTPVRSTMVMVCSMSSTITRAVTPTTCSCMHWVTGGCPQHFTTSVSYRLLQ